MSPSWISSKTNSRCFESFLVVTKARGLAPHQGNGPLVPLLLTRRRQAHRVGPSFKCLWSRDTLYGSRSPPLGELRPVNCKLGSVHKVPPPAATAALEMRSGSAASPRTSPSRPEGSWWGRRSHSSPARIGLTGGSGRAGFKMLGLQKNPRLLNSAGDTVATFRGTASGRNSVTPRALALAQVFVVTLKNPKHLIFP